MTDKTPEKIHTTLIETENAEHLRAMQIRAEKFARVAKEIETILVRENMTWGEWGEVVELYSTRIGQFVSNIKIDFLNQNGKSKIS